MAYQACKCTLLHSMMCNDVHCTCVMLYLRHDRAIQHVIPCVHVDDLETTHRTFAQMFCCFCSVLFRLCSQACRARQEDIHAAALANQLLKMAHLHGDVCLTVLTLTPEPPQGDLNLFRTCVGIYTMQHGNLQAARSLDAATMLSSQ